MLHVLRNNLKNVLLTKTLEPGSESGHCRHNWSWSEPDVSLFHTSYSRKYQAPSDMVSCLPMVSSGQGQGWCHLVSSCAIHLTIWHWSGVPCSTDAHHSALMSRPNSNKKNVNAVCVFFRQKYLIQWSSFMWKRLIWNTWRVFRKMINTCGV